ncbi:hypothetical protein GW17_00014551, partial [Ensete ventricosum]
IPRLPAVVARGSRPLFLPREETECLPALGDKSRRHRLLSGNTIDWGSFCLEIHLYRLISTVAARYRVVSIEGEGRRGRRKGRTWRFGVALLRRSQSVATLPHRSSGVGDEMSPPRLRRRGIDRDHVILWAPRFDGADSFYMVPKLKGVSRDIHLILMKHLMEELR